MTKWDEAWEAWDDVEIPKTKSTPEEPSVEVKSKGKGSGFVWFAVIAIAVLTIVYMSGEDSKPPNGGSTFSPVKGTDPVTFPPPPVNRPSPGPVTLPEGTWQPPSYSEQKMVQKRTTMNAPEAVSEGGDDPAELLTIIEDPRYRDREATRRRFDFILRQFVALCPMVSTSRSRFADMMARMLTMHEEIGLDREEGLLALSNNLHGLTTEISALANLYGYPMQDCTGVWAMYMGLRQKGFTPERAKEDVVGVVMGLFNAAGPQR